MEEKEIQLISIADDPLLELAAEVKSFGIASPVASDPENRVCRSYGIGKNCSSMGGKAGHIFVLVGKDGQVKWVRDYDMLMYVPVNRVYQEMSRSF